MITINFYFHNMSQKYVIHWLFGVKHPNFFMKLGTYAKLTIMIMIGKFFLKKLNFFFLFPKGGPFLYFEKIKFIRSTCLVNKKVSPWSVYKSKFLFWGRLLLRKKSYCHFKIICSCGRATLESRLDSMEYRLDSMESSQAWTTLCPGWTPLWNSQNVKWL